MLLNFYIAMCIIKLKQYRAKIVRVLCNMTKKCKQDAYKIQ